MEIKKVTFTEKELHDTAEKYFMRAGGFDPSKEKHQRMIEMAETVRVETFIDSKVEANYVEFGPEAFNDKAITIGEHTINGNCFELLDQDSIVKFYAFIITAGHIDYEKYESIVNQLHADMWGTAYVDAGRDFMEEYLKECARREYPEKWENEIFFSQELSPGFYGIPTNQSIAINNITEGFNMGIDVKETGVMVPLKTCSGIFVVVTDKDKLPLESCVDCIIHDKGCMHCKKKPTGEATC